MVVSPLHLVLGCLPERFEALLSASVIGVLAQHTQLRGGFAAEGAAFGPLPPTILPIQGKFAAYYRLGARWD